MGRLFPLFVVLTLALGGYWTVMSGYFAERAISLQVRQARGTGAASEMADKLQAALDRTAQQRKLVENIHFVARHPDWTNIDATERTLKELLAKAQPEAGMEGTLVQTDAVEELKQAIGEVGTLQVNALGSQQSAVTVGFWVCLVASLVTWAGGVIARNAR